VPVLLLCTFLMGLHSTLFGPVKFAYLPQVLSERELTGGNGMVEMGTFVAILLGNVAGRAAGGDARGRRAGRGLRLPGAGLAGGGGAVHPARAGHRPAAWSSTGTPSPRPGAT
jgi:MFS family permease